MNLDQLFTLEGADKSSNGHNYAEVYELLFANLRNSFFTLIEIGVYQGASIRAWLQHFPSARIVGIDNVKQWATGDPRFTFFQGVQQDPEFLDEVVSQVANVQIIIDDGSHRPVDQIASFEKLWPVLAPGGFYVIEDVQCWADADQDRAYTHHGDQFLFELFQRVNLMGRDYIGRPGPPRDVEPTLRQYKSVLLTKGLIAILKK